MTRETEKVIIFGYIKYKNSDKCHQSGLIVDGGLCPTLMARTQGDSARVAVKDERDQKHNR